MNAPVPCSPQGVTSGTAWSGWNPLLRRGAGGEAERLCKGKEGTGVIFEKRGSGNYSRKSLLVVILSASVGATSSATA